MINAEMLNWISPSEALAGEQLLIHVIWVPLADFDERQFLFPPDPPLDIQYGDWNATPYFYEAAPTRMSRWDAMVPATVNLFQESDDQLVVTTQDEKEWWIPKGIDFILARP
jgi:hypothetical protein